jgi:RNA polymerase sigma factor (sigma-70 family)
MNRQPTKLFQPNDASIRVAGMDDKPAGASDAVAFERLLRAHARPLLQFADFVLHDQSAAEDAVQEALILAWRRRQTVRDGTAVGAWLRKIVLRECLRWRRRRFFQVLGLSDRVVAPSRPDPTMQLDLARAVRRLSPTQRAVIFLHFYEDLTLAQIASAIGVPDSTVKTRLYAALRHLEHELPGYIPPGGDA